MRCEAAQRELSARMDAAPDRSLDERLGAHLATCGRCRAFEAGAWGIRERVRLEPADPVPDLVPRIMDEVSRGAGAPHAGLLRRWGREVAAFAAAALVVAVVLGGLPGLRRGPQPVRAADIPGRVAAASTQVLAYRATFDVTERHYAPGVPVRRFESRIAFRAPEGFRAEIRDLTAYPDAGWPRNDVTLAVSGPRWSVSGPSLCPREALPACARGGRETRAVRGREPFDGDAPIPTDIVLPIKTLSSSGRLRPLGTDSVAGADAVRVALDHRDAVPLFAYLEAGGSWRPFFPLDRVEVSLDRETWFPLAYRVIVSPSPERDDWALRNGLPRERPGSIVFEARARAFERTLPPGWRARPASPPHARDGGFREAPWSALRGIVGFRPAAPTDRAGLRRHRAGTLVGRDGRTEVLTSYVRGLSWVKVRETRAWDGRRLFGDIDASAPRIRLPGGGIAYHEHPTESLGRRLAIHGEHTDIFLESNLPLPEMLRVAGSLSVRGIPVPESWRVRRVAGGILREGVSLERARRSAPFLLLPRRLPAEYRLWNAALFRGEDDSRAVTLAYRRTGGELRGDGIRLHQASGVGLAPPTDPGTLAVRVRGVRGRYSPLRGELEWMEEGTYRSLRGEGLDLARLLRVAGSLEGSG